MGWARSRWSVVEDVQWAGAGEEDEEKQVGAAARCPRQDPALTPDTPCLGRFRKSGGSGRPT
eukprot:508087-Pyramimonas_sp.AAC.1